MKNRRVKIGYMPIEDGSTSEQMQTNGGGEVYQDPQMIEPAYMEPELNVIDPLQPADYPTPDDVAAVLEQPIAEQTPPAQLQSTLAPTEPAAEVPATGVNWKMVIAIVLVGYLLMRKS
jgi:hypothetical protein